MKSTIINNLLNELNESDIKYCHWKSNNSIEDALRGIGDLDILIDKKDKTIFRQLLKKYKFVESFKYKDRWFKEIFHFYSYDKTIEKLIHIHLHEKLMIGDDYTKDIHFKIEQSLFETSIFHENIRITCPESELSLLVIRAILKRNYMHYLFVEPLTLFKNVFQKKYIELGKGLSTELEYLKNKVTDESLKKWQEINFSKDLINIFPCLLNSIELKSKPLSWVTANYKLRKIINRYSIYNNLQRIFITFFRIVIIRGENFLKKINLIKSIKRIPETGGKIIAFIGSDGAGKSTNISLLSDFLSNVFYVKTLHIGRPKPCIKMKIANKLHLLFSNFKKISSLFESLLFLLIAEKRKNIYKKALKAKNNGFIVILDRFPIKNNTQMDCPKIRMMKETFPFKNFLLTLEEKYYSKISKVNKIIALKISYDKAKERRPLDNPEILKLRNESMNNSISNEIDFKVVDASKDLNEVQNIVRQTAWDLISSKNISFELIGPAGSGKTTLFNALSSHYTIMKINSIKEYPILCLKVLILNLFFLISLLYKIPTSFIKSIFYFLALNEILEKNKNKFPPFIIMDQGPYFLKAYYEFNLKNNFNLKLQMHLDEKLKTFIDRVIFLYADDETLFQRVLKRQRFHNVKNIQEQEALMYIKKYKDIYFNIMEKSKDLKPILNIKTDSLTETESIKAIYNFLDN